MGSPGSGPAAAASSVSSGPAVADDRVAWDLTAPPPPAALGVRPGSSTVSYARRSGSSMLDVDLRLPDSRRLHTPAIAVHVATGAGTLGNQIVVNRVEPTVSAAASAVGADADTLGLDRTALESFEPSTQGATTPVTAVLHGRRLGYLTVEVELRYTPDNDDVLVNYLLGWDGGSSASSPTA